MVMLKGGGAVLAAPRRALLILLAVALAGLAVGTRAEAATTYSFCGNSSSPVFLYGGNDRCAAGYHGHYTWTRAYSTQGLSSCAIVKTGSDGGGYNATAPACGPNSPGGYQQSNCGSPYSCAGYATITLGQASSGDYFGLFEL
jgi:hypothetical protein